jgi:exopolyphosphatase/pppGpp-phosphohydrolase
MILNEAIRLFRTESVTVSPYGVREGYLIDHVLKGEFPPADGGDSN